jgi:hypothetical protein
MKYKSAKKIAMFMIFLVVLALGNHETSAGSCSCSPEVSNATAEVTSTCAKTWRNRHCTLREDGVANTSQPAIAWFGQARGLARLSVDTDLRADFSSGPAARQAALFPQLRSPQMLYASLAYVLSDMLNPQEGAELLDAVSSNIRWIEANWQNSQVQSRTIGRIILAVQSGCLYARSSNGDWNFYINTAPVSATQCDFIKRGNIQ